eukprot:TRINITY_DN1717_c0_g1_i2.p2 TRINITY_DN1717_c0_g1~~TRINITY_DN1717_c0_g1_i2.p2  ORF type:complete len:554 (-),score=127.43 TRINITY_DN1717_c0_g1_i2:2896-4557(-)
MEQGSQPHYRRRRPKKVPKLPVDDAPQASSAPQQASSAPQQASLLQQQQQKQQAPSIADQPRQKLFMTSTPFTALPLSKETQAALSGVMKFEFMTRVQLETLPVIMTGADVLARAKTGTGKTVAFLTPSIERLLRDRPQHGDISVLVVSPTRELAAQIAVEARALLTYHPFKVQCVVGGTNMKTEQKLLANAPCDFLVATPGRLIDHLENTTGLAARIGRVRVLILDEADQLLEMGFRPAIEKILVFTNKSRQTLLFSATFSDALRSVVHIAMRSDHKYIDTVGEEESTNAHVIQKYVITPLADQLPTLVSLILAQMREPDHKIIVFCTTARLTQYMAELFNAMGIHSLEIHSRKSQGHRTKVSEQFRKATNAVMFSSDVSARGMDYPDVTFVCQVGIPSDREQYVHRLGRTGRAGRPGHGLLLLADFERFFLHQLRDLPIAEHDKVEFRGDIAEKIRAGQHKLPQQTLTQAYGAWLGFYNSHVSKLRWDKVTLVQQANYYASLLGCAEPPALQRKTLGKMGLTKPLVAGLRVADPEPQRPRPQSQQQQQQRW